MEKKQNDMDVMELSMDQMDKISGGAGNSCGEEQPEESPAENTGSILQEYVPGKKGTRRRDPLRGGN